jgi:hypothetical protein
MTIDQKLNLIRRALELGANVNVYIHDIETKEEAKEIENKLQPLTSAPFEEEESENNQWLQSQDHENNIGIIVFYEKPSPSKGFPF